MTRNEFMQLAALSMVKANATEDARDLHAQDIVASADTLADELECVGIAFDEEEPEPKPGAWQAPAGYVGGAGLR